MKKLPVSENVADFLRANQVLHSLVYMIVYFVSVSANISKKEKVVQKIKFYDI